MNETKICGISVGDALVHPYSVDGNVPSIIPDTPTANGRGFRSERMRTGTASQSGTGHDGENLYQDR